MCPLHLRDIRIYMDRFQFTHNPSSCEASQLISTLTGSGETFSNPADDSTATVGEHFQLLNCLTLGFRPRLGLRLRGSARRGGYPSLRASFVSRGAKDSNLKRIEVEMPHSLFLAQNHIRTVCTREQFAAQSCPAGSVYGKAVAHTPLFDDPLRGDVYLRSSSNRLPDLVADLRSGQVRIVVEGRIGPGRHGGILTFFDNLPDAPIERFTMTLLGGRRGLLQNSSNICNNPPLATVSALGQNNIGARFSSDPARPVQEEERWGRGERLDDRPERQPARQRQRQTGAEEAAAGGHGADRGHGRRQHQHHRRQPAAAAEDAADRAEPPRPPRLQGPAHLQLRRIQPGSSSRALSQCRSALVGRGSFTANITLAGQEPYPTSRQPAGLQQPQRRKACPLRPHLLLQPFATSFVIVFRDPETAARAPTAPP